jgi:tetratricopeptide (TPR) repeat protein
VGAISGFALLGLAAFAGVLGAGMPALYKRLNGVAAFTINTSFNYIGLGKLSEASRLLDEAEERPHFMWVRRLVDVQRAIIAMRLGKLAEARERLDAAIARPLGIFEQANSLYQIEGAFALRAFVLSSLGEREAALADIAEVRSRPNASLDALAKVALAEALLLERSGERAKLKELIEREETLLLEHTHPRERAIVRGLQRMLRASSKGSIYRQTAAVDPAEKEEEPPLADWVAKIAPDVAPFVRVPRRSTDGSPAAIAASAAVAPQAEAVRAVARAHAVRALGKQKREWLLLAVAAPGVMFLGILLVYGITSIQLPDLPAGAAAPAVGIPPWAWLLPMIALSVAAGVAWRLNAKKRARMKGAGGLKKSASGPAARGGAGGEARGEETERGAVSAADAHAEALAMSPSDLVAAQARLVLASRAERRGDFEAVVRECRQGIGRLDDAKSRAEADIVYPDLIALAAFGLAAIGRSDEADAELALLGPTYPHHARAVFRVRLVQFLRRRDLAGAARWVDQGAADLPLSIREELLADIVRALAAPSEAGAGEIERLKDELRRSAERRRWIDTVAPGLVSAFEQSGEVHEEELSAQPRVRVGVPAPPPPLAASGSSAEDAEAEARAEAEAAEAAARGFRGAR